MLLKALPILCVLLFAMGPIGCGNGSPSPKSTENSNRLKITATTGMIADTARVIGGAHVDITGLMGPGVDPHLYKATPSDIDALRDADLILYNGLHLEGRMADLLVKMARQIDTLQVTETIPEDLLREPPEFLGQYDPHVWFDVSMWRYVAERVRDAFKDADPAHAADFEANASSFIAELDTLHIYAQEQTARIPKSSRVLVTAHDAFGYFGRAYGLDVVGLQGISTASEYGLQDMKNVIDVIVARKIRAVFIESSVPPKSIEALIAGARSRGHQLHKGGELFSDAMGQAGTPEGTYLGMVRHNVDTIVGALTGTATSHDAIPAGATE